jgi:hypothetical protein
LFQFLFEPSPRTFTQPRGGCATPSLRHSLPLPAIGETKKARFQMAKPGLSL